MSVWEVQSCCKVRLRTCFVGVMCFGIMPYGVPRFRLPAPLRGSTPRQCLVLSLDFRYLCRSAQDDTEGGVSNEGIILVRQSNIATNGLYLTKRHTLCVILSGAAQRCKGEHENHRMPRSRTPKGRRQAESRHSCMASQRIASRLPIGCDSRTLQRIPSKIKKLH